MEVGKERTTAWQAVNAVGEVQNLQRNPGVQKRWGQGSLAAAPRRG